MRPRLWLPALVAAATLAMPARAAEEPQGTTDAGLARPLLLMENDPPLVVGRVIVKGPENMQTLLLGRCLPVEEGSSWDVNLAERIEATRQELLALDWVSEVDVRWRGTGDPRVKDLIFEVKASRTGSLYLGLGYRGRYGLAPTAALFHESLLDTLLYLHAHWTLAMQVRPNFSTQPMNIGQVEVGRPPVCTRWYWKAKYTRSLEGIRYFHLYDQTAHEMRLTAGRLLPWRFQVEGGYTLSHVGIGPAPSGYALPEGLSAGRYRVGGATLALVHDSRNDKGYARWGHFLKIEALAAHRWLLSDHDFAKVSLTYHRYLWAARRLVVKPVLSVSWASHGVAFTERPYPLETEWSQAVLGGSLGPLSNMNEIGGRLAAFVGIESRLIAVSGALHLSLMAGGANAWGEPVRPFSSRPLLRPFVGLRFDAPIPGGAYMGMALGWIPR